MFKTLTGGGNLSQTYRQPAVVQTRSRTCSHFHVDCF